MRCSDIARLPAISLQHSEAAMEIVLVLLSSITRMVFLLMLCTPADAKSAGQHFEVNSSHLLDG
jgi:hypothetical protein